MGRLNYAAACVRVALEAVWSWIVLMALLLAASFMIVGMLLREIILLMWPVWVIVVVGLIYLEMR